jgi:hypothetical protein
LGVGLVVVSLNISVLHRFVEAADNWFDFELGVRMSKSIGEDVSGCHLHRLLEQIVLKHDEPGVDSGGIPKDVFPVLKDLLRSDGTGVDVEVYPRINRDI